MNSNFSRIVSYLVMAIVLYFSFSIHSGLGLAAVIVIIGLYIFSKRNAVLLQRALNESSKGNRKEALLLLEKAYRIDPNNVAIAINYAYLSLKSGEVEKADQLLEKAAQQSNSKKFHNNIEMNVALVRWKQGRLQEGIEILERVHSKIKTTTVYGSLGYLYIEQGDLDQALSFNMDAYDYNDGDPVIMDNLFLTRILREEWDEAAVIGAKLLELNPKFPEASYHHALLLLHHGDLTGALEQLDTALGRTFTSVSTESRETVERKRDEVAKQLNLTDPSITIA